MHIHIQSVPVNTAGIMWGKFFFFSQSLPFPRLLLHRCRNPSLMDLDEKFIGNIGGVGWHDEEGERSKRRWGCCECQKPDQTEVEGRILTAQIESDFTETKEQNQITPVE